MDVYVIGYSDDGAKPYEVTRHVPGKKPKTKNYTPRALYNLLANSKIDDDIMASAGKELEEIISQAEKSRMKSRMKSSK